MSMPGFGPIGTGPINVIPDAGTTVALTAKGGAQGKALANQTGQTSLSSRIQGQFKAKIAARVAMPLQAATKAIGALRSTMSRAAGIASRVRVSFTGRAVETGRTSLTSRVAAAFKARLTFAGRTSLAGHVEAQVKNRLSILVQMPFQATAKAVGKLRSTPSWTARISARVEGQAKARATATGRVSILGQVAASFRGRLGFSGRSALVAREAGSTRGRASASGTTRVTARSAAEARARAQGRVTAPLTGRDRSSGALRGSPRAQAVLQAMSAAQGHLRAAAGRYALALQGRMEAMAKQRGLASLINTSVALASFVRSVYKAKAHPTVTMLFSGRERGSAAAQAVLTRLVRMAGRSKAQARNRAGFSGNVLLITRTEAITKGRVAPRAVASLTGSSSSRSTSQGGIVLSVFLRGISSASARARASVQPLILLFASSQLMSRGRAVETRGLVFLRASSKIAGFVRGLVIPVRPVAYADASVASMRVGVIVSALGLDVAVASMSAAVGLSGLRMDVDVVPASAIVTVRFGV